MNINQDSGRAADGEELALLRGTPGLPDMGTGVRARESHLLSLGCSWHGGGGSPFSPQGAEAPWFKVRAVLGS